MRKVIRFILAVLIVAGVISLFGRLFFDFDQPPEYDPHDLLRGIGIWATAVLVAVLDVLRSRRCAGKR